MAMAPVILPRLDALPEDADGAERECAEIPVDGPEILLCVEMSTLSGAIVEKRRFAGEGVGGGRVGGTC